MIKNNLYETFIIGSQRNDSDSHEVTNIIVRRPPPPTTPSSRTAPSRR